MISIWTILHSFVKLAFLNVAFFKIETKLDMSKKSFDFVPPYRYQHLVKISWSYLCCSRGIRGMPPPKKRMPLGCRKRQIPLTVKQSHRSSFVPLIESQNSSKNLLSANIIWIVSQIFVYHTKAIFKIIK